MRLKVFTAATMALAMEQVRRDLGEDAIIVSTQSLPGGRGARVSAAIEDAIADEAFFPGGWDEDADLPPPRPATRPANPLCDALVFHGVPPPLDDRLIQATAAYRGESHLLALAGALDSIFGFEPFANLAKGPPRMLIGPPGAGKTIACAKLLLRARKQGLPALAITTDLRRAGGIEQLEAFTRILGQDLVTADTPEALAQATETAGNGVALIDTPGINPFDPGELKDLAALVKAARAEPVLVLAAGTDAGDASDIARAFAQMGTHRLLPTRLDAARRLGSLLAAADGGGLAFADAGFSANVADGLNPLNPVSFARLLLPREETQSSPLQSRKATA
jgi:flagellar biosynthesis protein FlhF